MAGTHFCRRKGEEGGEKREREFGIWDFGFGI
jgi:hypothetical protein